MSLTAHETADRLGRWRWSRLDEAIHLVTAMGLPRERLWIAHCGLDSHLCSGPQAEIGDHFLSAGAWVVASVTFEIRTLTLMYDPPMRIS